MAEKILNTRILMKVDTLENWEKSTLPLKKGELAFATVAATAGTGLTEPVVMVKIGEDGVKTFKDLSWNFYAKASDVLGACKNEDTLRAFINGVIADAGIASDDAMQELADRVKVVEDDYLKAADKTELEGKITANTNAITNLVGDTKVADQISTAIANLDLANTYAAKTHGHEIAEVNGLSDAIAAAKKAGTDANSALEAYKTLNDAAVKVNSDAIAGIKNGETLDNFKEVEEALAGKQAAGDYSVNGHKHEIADVNGLSDAIADAKKAGTDAATAAGKALTDAKAYTDSEMTRLVGDKTVGTQIETVITNLDLANTYDAKGAAADAETAAKGHADDLNTAMDTRVKALEAIDHSHENATVLDGITADKVAAWDAAEKNAKDHADGLNTTMDGRVAALEALFEDGEGSVADQIADAVAAEAEIARAAEKANADAIDAIEADYLKAADKTALQEQITANADAVAALDELVGDESVAKQIEDAVKVEKERAEGIEGGLETRLAAVEADYLKAADKTELEGKITANANAIELLTNGVSAEEVDGVNDLIQYVKDHGAEVTGIKADIKANADAIDAIEADYLKAADKTELSGLITGLDTRMGDAEDAIDAIEAELDTATTGLKARMTQAEADIDALEAKVGDETVAKQIEDAIDALKIGDYAKAADLTAAVERIAKNETDISGLSGRMDTAEGKITALEGDVAKKANDADLHAIAKSGNVNDLVQTDGDVLVFDCGTSAV